MSFVRQLQTGEMVKSIFAKSSINKKPKTESSNKMPPLMPEQNEDSKKLSAIAQKLKQGLELTTDEMNFLKEKDPELYKLAMKIKMERQALEQRLKACKTKEEARIVYAQAQSQIASELKKGTASPSKEIKNEDAALMRTKAAHDVYKRFTETEKFQKMPQSSNKLSLNGGKENEDESEKQEGKILDVTA